MASVILELLEAEGQGTYLHGKLCFPEWAPEVRERVRNRFASALCASVPISVNCNCTEALDIAILEYSSPPSSTTEPEVPEVAFHVERLTYVTSTTLAEVVADMRAKNP
jgi:hypothetical protein